MSVEDSRRRAYVIGQTGRSKTTFPEFCILQDICAGGGLALIDPPGDLADEIVDSLPRSRTRDVVFVNPSDTDWAWTPLSVPLAVPLAKW